MRTHIDWVGPRHVRNHSRTPVTLTSSGTPPQCWRSRPLNDRSLLRWSMRSSSSTLDAWRRQARDRKGGWAAKAR
jgi:hypothetical protein